MKNFIRNFAVYFCLLFAIMIVLDYVSWYFTSHPFIAYAPKTNLYITSALFALVMTIIYRKKPNFPENKKETA